MAAEQLRMLEQPDIHEARMVLGFTGWMDGGDVSTGTVETLVAKLGGRLLAEIEPHDFYILSFPGSMELSALFRPHVKIEDGLITAWKMPTNRFYYCGDQRLILFEGREPNLNWPAYAECILAIAERFGVGRIHFIGSVAGLVPHTRQPRLYSSASAAALKPALEQYGLRFNNYEGPSSLVTYLTRVAPQRGVEMVTVVAEIPAYVQGRNYRCIEAVVRQLAAMLDLQLELDDLRRLGDELEERLSAAVEEHEDLAERISKLEEDYDSEVFDTQMDDLKDWLQRRGIRLD